MYSEHLCAGLSTFFAVHLLSSHFADKKPEVLRLHNFPKVKRVISIPYGVQKGVGMWIYFLGPMLIQRGAEQ